MPVKEQHLLKAERNATFAQFLAEKTKYIDWAVTMLFYSALHYFDAVLAVSGEHPKNHQERHDAIDVNDTLKQVYREYRVLETASWNSRYFTMPIEAADWQAVKPKFDTLRSHVRKHLGM